jgi:hypothetical protein
MTLLRQQPEQRPGTKWSQEVKRASRWKRFQETEDLVERVVSFCEDRTDVQAPKGRVHRLPRAA